MEGVASWFYGKVYDAFLECLIKRVQKSKKLIGNWSARVSNGCQEERRSAYMVRC
jgi:hypothetical protein